MPYGRNWKSRFFQNQNKKNQLNSCWSSRKSPRKRPGSSKSCWWVSWTRKLVGRIGKPTKCLNWWTPIFVLILKCTIVGINELDLLITDFYEGAWPLTCIQNGAIRFCDHLANVGFKDLLFFDCEWLKMGTLRPCLDLRRSLYVGWGNEIQVKLLTWNTSLTIDVTWIIIHKPTSSTSVAEHPLNPDAIIN